MFISKIHTEPSYRLHLFFSNLEGKSFLGFVQGLKASHECFFKAHYSSLIEIHHPYCKQLVFWHFWFIRLTLINSYNNKKKKRRQKREYYFNPPHELNVKTNVAHEVFKALQRTIPRGNQLYPLLNRHTVKVSYSTMSNLEKRYQTITVRLLKKRTKKSITTEEDAKTTDTTATTTATTTAATTATTTKTRKRMNCRNGVQSFQLKEENV